MSFSVIFLIITDYIQSNFWHWQNTDTLVEVSTQNFFHPKGLTNLLFRAKQCWYLYSEYIVDIYCVFWNTKRKNKTKLIIIIYPTNCFFLSWANFVICSLLAAIAESSHTKSLTTNLFRKSRINKSTKQVMVINVNIKVRCLSWGELRKLTQFYSNRQHNIDNNQPTLQKSWLIYWAERWKLIKTYVSFDKDGILLIVLLVI